MKIGMTSDGIEIHDITDLIKENKNSEILKLIADEPLKVFIPEKHAPTCIPIGIGCYKGMLSIMWMETTEKNRELPSEKEIEENNRRCHKLAKIKYEQSHKK